MGLACINNNRQIALAFMMHAGDHNEHLPPLNTGLWPAVTPDWWAYDFPPYHGPAHKLTPFRGGFKSASGNTPGEGRGSFKGSLAPGDTDPAHFRMSGSVRITVN